MIRLLASLPTGGFRKSLHSEARICQPFVIDTKYQLPNGRPLRGNLLGPDKRANRTNEVLLHISGKATNQDLRPAPPVGGCCNRAKQCSRHPTKKCYFSLDAEPNKTNLSLQIRVQSFHNSVLFSLLLGIPLVPTLRQRREAISTPQIDDALEFHRGC